MFSFTVHKRLHDARLTQLITPHGTLEGPFFQFVATQGVIKGGVFAEDLQRLPVQIILANTYHLHLRPGEDVVAQAGGLHGFTQWAGPMITDSGGYQVFSLGDNVTLDGDGVNFQSPLNGDTYRLTSETAIQIQQKLGADIIMPLDVCTPFGARHDEVAAAVTQTLAWAKRCKAEHERLQAEGKTPQALYGIVQGSTFPDLRQACAEALVAEGFFGYSIGGELRDISESQIEDGVRMTTPHLPQDAPRYLMGSGTPEDIVRAVRAGVDQFDCVLPVRNARHGKVYRNLNREALAKYLQEPDQPVDPKVLYETVDIRKSGSARDFSVFAPGHPVIEKPYTMAYVHHLARSEAPTAARLLVLQNIFFYGQLMQAIRDIIAEHGVVI